MNSLSQIEQVKADFIKSGKLLIAIGDETRQNIITVLMEACCDGMRVGDITARTHLSRPAVSHHMKILLDCGMVGVDKHGTKNFYYLNIGEDFMVLQRLIDNIVRLQQEIETDSCIGG